MDIDELSLAFGNYLAQNGCECVQVVETENKSKMIKRLVISTAPNELVCKQLSQSFIENFLQTIRPLHKDGLIRGEWVVLDYDSIVVHIMVKGVRQKYNLEKLWKDSKNFINIDASKNTI